MWDGIGGSAIAELGDPPLDILRAGFGVCCWPWTGSGFPILGVIAVLEWSGNRVPGWS